jgi:3-oxo-5-alpha-steroid 4-dehydrogenase 3 / polyprenol reductase
MTIFEEKLPNSIRQMFRYGKHSHKGESDKLIELIEIPKSWFSHFYVFAIFWSWFWLILSISIYFYEYQPSQLLLSYLDLSCGRDRQPESKLS